LQRGLPEESLAPILSASPLLRGTGIVLAWMEPGRRRGPLWGSRYKAILVSQEEAAQAGRFGTSWLTASKKASSLRPTFCWKNFHDITLRELKKLPGCNETLLRAPMMPGKDRQPAPQQEEGVMFRAFESGIAGGIVFVSMIGLATAGEGTLKVAPSSVAVPMVKAGEISLAVVPPGKNRICPGGRVLIANDEHGPAWGPERRLDEIVSGIDLLTGASTPSLFDEPPNPLDYQHNWSSDKNMVSLPNGEVIYQAPSFSKRPITAIGADSTWFNSTFHFDGNTKQPDFGPGARTVMGIWRSRDCGATFQYVGEADPAAFGNNGECAYPQPPVLKASDGTLRSSMGGTDGPWLGVDRTTGALILTHGCVGNFPMATAPAAPKCPTPLMPVQIKDFHISPEDETPPFLLSNCPLWKTYVLTSTNSGKDWTTKGVIDADWWMWRAMAVPLPQNKLAVGWNGAVYLGTPTKNGMLNFKPIPGPAITVGYDSSKLPNATIEELGLADPRPTILARVPGTTGKVFLLAPNTLTISLPFKKRTTHGYKIFIVDTATGTWSEPTNPFENILPKGTTTNDFVMHLTAVDTGEGPILFYWYDVSATTKTAVIRGRIYFSENFMTDFVISKKDGNDASFNLLGPNGAYSYRHYKMAEGFHRTSGSGLLMKKTYEYFPAWVEPDGVGTAHFSRVTVTVPLLTVDKVRIGNTTFTLSKVSLQTRRPSSLGRVPALSPEFLRFLEEHEQERGRP
jgi:hypothetical protein